MSSRHTLNRDRLVDFDTLIKVFHSLTVVEWARWAQMEAPDWSRAIT